MKRLPYVGLVNGEGSYGVGLDALVRHAVIDMSSLYVAALSLGVEGPPLESNYVLVGQKALCLVLGPH